MSISAGLHCSTSATILSWPANTWQSCSLRLAVSSGLLSAPEGPKWLCWSHSCPRPLPRLPLCAVPRAPPGVRSRKFRTSVWERRGLEEGKVVAMPAKEWFPGSGFLRENKEFNLESRHLYVCLCLPVWVRVCWYTCALSVGNHPGEALLCPEGRPAPWRDPQQMYTEEAWGDHTTVISGLAFQAFFILET